MVKSLIVSALLHGSLGSGVCPNDECETMSALQMSVRGRGNARMSATVSKIMQALHGSDNTQHVCTTVEAGEEAPVDGIFTAEHSSQKVNVLAGTVAEVGGTFCVEASTLSLLQRAHGLSEASDFERVLSDKGGGSSNDNGKDTESSTSGKGGKKKPKPQPQPEPESESEPEADPEPSPTPEADTPAPTPGADTPAPTPGADTQAPSPDDEFGNYPELPHCDSEGGGFGDSFCQGGNRYGCRLSVIVNNCGSSDNACCADTDGSCTDGDDNVKCITERTFAPTPTVIETPAPTPATPPPYGTLPSCADTGHHGSRRCWGNNQYGCSQEHIESECGSLDNACCSDADGSCADGDDEVKCIASQTTTTVAPDMPEYGAIQSCDVTGSVGDWICYGMGRYGCTLANIEELCGSVDNACCSDDDGSCEDGDDRVKCQAEEGPAPTPAPDLPPYGQLQHSCKEESERVSEIFCQGNNRYGCDEVTIKSWCTTVDQACCADQDGSCEDGDDAVACKTLR